MKILLANLPWINNREYIGLRAGSRWPHLRMKKESLPYFPFPFSLAYAASVLKREGHEVYLNDGLALEMTRESFMEIVSDFKPEAVVFETSTPSLENDLAYTREVKDKFKAKTILCGPHATARPRDLLNEPYVDFVLQGEYEYVLARLIGSLKNGENPSLIKGVGSRYNDEVIINERAGLIEDLDSLPYPLREALPMAKYVDGFCKFIPNVQMITSRGCPYNCIFCLEPSVYYGKPNYRLRSPQAVIEEMEYLICNFGAREIYFDDSSFSVNQTRVKEIGQTIINRGLKVYWSCMADARLEPETLRLMKRANCLGLKFGVESAEAKILENIHKHINLQDVKNLVRACRKIGLSTHATYMFGLPGETKESLKKTIDFAFSLKTDTAQFSLAIPFPGTPFYDLAIKNKWLTSSRWTDFDGERPIIAYPDLKGEDILKALRYCRKRIIWKTISHPKLFLQYLVWLKRYSGLRDLITTLGTKINYLFKRR